VAYEQVRTRATLSAGWRKGLLWGFVATVALTWASAAPSGYWVGAIVVTALLALVFLPVALLRVDVRAGRDGIQATCFPLVRLRFSPADIAGVRPVDGRGGVHDGMGLRHLGNRTWGLLVGGSAVEVELRNGRRWVLSTPHPEEVAAAAAA